MLSYGRKLYFISAFHGRYLSHHWVSNPIPRSYQDRALPVELWRHVEPTPGLEPGASRLQVECSCPDELGRRVSLSVVLLLCCEADVTATSVVIHGAAVVAHLLCCGLDGMMLDAKNLALGEFRNTPGVRQRHAPKGCRIVELLRGINVVNLKTVG